jgi:hypothetical protein
MSYYARNHLLDDWASHEIADTQARVREGERKAGWYFDQATKHQKAEFDATLLGLLGMTGPRWDRARDSAKAQWQAATVEARRLLEATVECLMQTGEVSGELDDAWTALIDRDAAVGMAAE